MVWLSDRSGASRAISMQLKCRNVDVHFGMKHEGRRGWAPSIWEELLKQGWRVVIIHAATPMTETHRKKEAHGEEVLHASSCGDDGTQYPVQWIEEIVTDEEAKKV